MKKTWLYKVRPIRVNGEVAFVTLTRGLYAVIDADDVPLVDGWNWCAFPSSDARLWYAYSAGIRKIRLHQLLVPTPKGFMIDHIDHNGLNCRRQNLRVCDAKENAQHRRRRRQGLSPFKGVSPHNNNWRARIVVDNTRINLGTFTTQEMAAIAYDKAAAKFFGEFAYLNFPAREGVAS